MQINTKDFGLLEVNESDIITFPDGIYAFRDVSQFVLLDQDSENGIVQLQSAISETPRLILLDPFMYLKDYNPKIPDEEVTTLEANDKSDLTIFVVAVVPEDISQMTVNLKSPVIINFKTKRGLQCILENNYPTRHFLFEREGAVE